jgi:hypothetical protein
VGVNNWKRAAQGREEWRGLIREAKAQHWAVAPKTEEEEEEEEEEEKKEKEKEKEKEKKKKKNVHYQ